MRGSLGRWAPVALWMALIFALSAQSTLPLPGVSWLDEALRVTGHFTEYAVLAFLVSRAAASTGRPAWRQFALALLVCAAYALSDEWHQSFVPGRDASLFDWLVDVSGAAAGGWVFGRYLARARPAG